MKVYILNARPYFKIGKADHIESRVQQFLTGCPFFIVSVAYLKHDFAHTIEFELHRRCHSQRGAGEWFALSDSDFSEIITTYGFKCLCNELLEWDNLHNSVRIINSKKRRSKRQTKT